MRRNDAIHDGEEDSRSRGFDIPKHDAIPDVVSLPVSGIAQQHAGIGVHEERTVWMPAQQRCRVG
jgi:hypothetical protein